MVKSVSAAFASELQSTTTTFARCWKIVRTDGEVFAFTSSDIDITLPSGSLAIRQSTNEIGEAGYPIQAVFPNAVKQGNLLIAFVTLLGDMSVSSFINTANWTIEAFNNPSADIGMWILSRYAGTLDGTTPPSVVNNTIDSGSGATIVMYEVSGVTGNHSVDVPYANVQYTFEAAATSGLFTGTAGDFAFALAGGFNNGTGTTSITVETAGWTTDQNVTGNVAIMGAHYTNTGGNTAQIEINGTGENYFVGIVGMNMPGLTFTPAQGFSPSAMESKPDLTVDNLEVQGIFDSESITVEDLRAGLFDYADVYLYLVNWAAPSQGVLNMRRGKLGEVTSSPQGWFQVELRGMTQLLQQQVVELYGPECRADVGDSRCTVPIDPPVWEPNNPYTTVVNMVNTGCFVKAVVNGASTYKKYGNVIFQCTTAGTSGSSPPSWNLTVGGTTADGGVVWTTVAAWMRTGTVASVVDPLDITVTWDAEDSRDVDTWYQYGILTFETGNNTGKSLDVKAWVKSAEQMTFYVPAGYPIQVGDVFHVNPGCDKSITTCISKFNNVLNNRAEPYLPGNDFTFYYPNSNGINNQAA